MTDKTIVSSVTLVSSLFAYLYAKEAGKDTVPYVMMGGFIGSLLGDAIVEKVTKSKHNN
jgi:uncharacterized membrane protein YfcA